MTMRPAETSPATEQRISMLMGEVERLTAEHRGAEAERALAAAVGLAPEHPLVLHEQARRAALAGDPQSARLLLEKATAAAPQHLPLWLTLAAVLRSLTLYAEELTALDRALALQPTHLVALLQKGAVLDLMQRPRAAAAVYGNALQTLHPGMRVPAAIDAHLAHARQRVSDNAANLAAVLNSRLQGVAPQAKATELGRFDRCIDLILGRRRIYAPQPTYMLFPFLVNHEFHPREQFPWLASLEAATAAIREELLAVLNGDGAGIQPYIAYEAGVPLNQWRELNHSRRWGAYFLWNEGTLQGSHAALCPRAVEALAKTPQVDIPGRGPTAFFSLLDARTHIPPHTGVTNTRLTVHLPLIVPPGCRFRVGGEIREWQTGTAWVFDDTIEHEAWNDSDAPRAILIFDIWNPQLTEVERDLVREATVALAQYNDAEAEIS
jgi:aspartyl/asparaginyl beta-hydroxylase (cupin superfamily)